MTCLKGSGDPASGRSDLTNRAGPWRIFIDPDVHIDVNAFVGRGMIVEDPRISPTTVWAPSINDQGSLWAEDPEDVDDGSPTDATLSGPPGGWFRDARMWTTCVDSVGRLSRAFQRVSSLPFGAGVLVP